MSVRGQNIEIASSNNPNEPSIAMDTAHPAYLIAGANLNNYFLSVDTGRTWTHRTLQSSHGVWGDPCIIVDTAGDFYFFHLSNPSNGNWIDRIVCQKTTDRGLNWNDGSYTGLNGTKAQDKEWCAIDPKTNTLYLTWTQFDEYGSNDPAHRSNILFSKSTDRGITWTDARQINLVDGDCIDSDNTVEGAVPAVGPEGQLYVSWAGPEGLVFNKSYDEGETWLPAEIHIDPMPGGWDYSIPGIFRANGLPVTICDHSHGPNRGTIYVNWSDQRNGPGDTDVWIAKSTDEGETWGEPVRVNNDPAGSHQFFTWMTIDQSNGNLYAVFYDRRNHPESMATDVYLAVSRDGGQTFTNHLISDLPFIPNSNIFFGDYTNITAHKGIIRPIWTRLHEGDLSLWTALLRETQLITSTPSDNREIFQPDLTLFPNPTHDFVYVSYKVHATCQTDISVHDQEGKSLKNLMQQERPYGSYIEKFNVAEMNLPAGLYFITLTMDGKLISSKSFIVD